jgi:hypothetical protein
VQSYLPRVRDLFINRLRFELREILDRNGAYETVLRVRYMLKYQRLLFHRRYDRNSIYLIALDEILLNGGSEVTGHHLYDQNRAMIGIGYSLGADVAIETGYMNQLQQHAHDDGLDLNHIWQLSLIIEGPRTRI